jgi:phage terminase large subunit
MLVRSQTFPPDYREIVSSRNEMMARIHKNPSELFALEVYYAENPIDFICDFVMTVDPRNAGKPGMQVVMPFYLFERQREMVLFLQALVDNEESGLVEKSRDIGATWLCCAFAVWMWRFRKGASIGFGSRKAQLVDRIGDMDSIFEKVRAIIRWIPRPFWPPGFDDKQHMSFMRIVPIATQRAEVTFVPSSVLKPRLPKRFDLFETATELKQLTGTWPEDSAFH